MLLTNFAAVLLSYRIHDREAAEDSAQIRLELPFSLTLALKYGIVFLLLHVAGGLTQRHFGNGGFYLVSVVGGLMSSASAVAAAATLAAQGSLSPTVAGTGAVLSSFTSLASSLSFVLRTRNRALIRRLATAMICVGVAGIIGLAVWNSARPSMVHWITQLQWLAK